MRNATKLQARSVQKLREELRIEADNERSPKALRGLPAPQIARLESVFALAERQLPVDPVYESFLERAGAGRAAHLAAGALRIGAGGLRRRRARASAFPVGMLLYSWDNLSTKGCLHRLPDWMFVWNERQRAEARALHEFPEDRVIITGAPRFDSFFELSPACRAKSFTRRSVSTQRKPTLLYVCSSLLVSAGELPFVRDWLAAIRGSSWSARATATSWSGRIRTSNCSARNSASEENPVAERSGARKGSCRGRSMILRAIVLKTSDRARQGLFESLYHSAAVVGLNTSAELEAAIVGTTGLYRDRRR